MAVTPAERALVPPTCRAWPRPSWRERVGAWLADHWQAYALLALLLAVYAVAGALDWDTAAAAGRVWAR